jgi:hypothetical protein
MPQNVAIRLNYMKWNDTLKGEKPYQLVSEDLPSLYGIPRQNFEFGSGPEEQISDIRNTQSIFNVDDHGFAILHHSFPEINFGDVASVEQVYQPEVERLLKEKIGGVDELYFFNWRVSDSFALPKSVLRRATVPADSGWHLKSSGRIADQQRQTALGI